MNETKNEKRKQKQQAIVNCGYNLRRANELLLRAAQADLDAAAEMGECITTFADLYGDAVNDEMRQAIADFWRDYDELDGEIGSSSFYKGRFRRGAHNPTLVHHAGCTMTTNAFNEKFAEFTATIYDGGNFSGRPINEYIDKTRGLTGEALRLLLRHHGGRHTPPRPRPAFVCRAPTLRNNPRLRIGRHRRPRRQRGRKELTPAARASGQIVQKHIQP